MEEAVAQRMAQEGLDQRVGKRVEIVAGGAQAVDVGHLDAVDPLHGDHVAAGALPIDRRHAEAGILLGVFGDFGKGGGLEPQIHLDLGGLLERLRDLDRPQAAAGRHEALLHVGDEIHRLDVVGEALAHAGADDLDGDLLAARRRIDLGRMHLGDRGGGNRLAEACIELVDRAAERALDARLGRRRREERHAVLQLREVVGKFDADDIRARRQELADLDVGGAEPLDGLRQPVAALLRLRAVAREQADKRLGEADGRAAGLRTAAPRRRLRAPESSRRADEPEICRARSRQLHDD